MLSIYKCSLSQVLTVLNMSFSSYYYKPKPGRKGRLPSPFSLHLERGQVSEQEVVVAIKALLAEEEFLDCGYHLMRAYLRDRGYVINHKKLYRIMKEAKLLKSNARIKRSGAGRKFVAFRKVDTSRPLQCVEMDIKMVWLPDRGKNAYLLTLLDIHTRKVLGYRFALSIKQKQVIDLCDSLMELGLLPEGVVIRSDNGSQFIARKVREHLHQMGIDQEFTHIATPEENAHVEAYHGTLRRDLFLRIEYSNFGQIEAIIDRYVLFYNTRRKHGLLGKITPQQKWEQDEHLILKSKKCAA